jgi:hypothetical protein
MTGTATAALARALAHSPAAASRARNAGTRPGPGSARAKRRGAQGTHDEGQPEVRGAGKRPWALCEREMISVSAVPQGDRERAQTLTVRGRDLRVAVRRGDPAWPPLLLCNGIGGRLELLQPFVDALDPRRELIRFDLPGIGGSPLPAVPYHLATLGPVLAGLLDQLGHQQADVLGISWGAGWPSSSRCGLPAGSGAWCWWPRAPGR